MDREVGRQNYFFLDQKESLRDLTRLKSQRKRCTEIRSHKLYKESRDLKIYTFKKVRFNKKIPKLPHSKRHIKHFWPKQRMKPETKFWLLGSNFAVRAKEASMFKTFANFGNFEF